MYRKAALDNHSGKTWNSKVLLISSVRGSLYLAFSLLIIGLLLSWLIFGTFTRRVDVHGELILLPHPVILNAPKSGYISEIFIAAGDTVKKDQALFKIRLKRTINSGDVGVNSKRLILTQTRQIDTIIANLEKSKTITLDNINSQIEKHQNILADIEGRLSEINNSIRELAKLIDGYKKLQQQGMATKNELISQRLNYFQQKTLYQDFYSKQIQQKITIATLQSELKTQANQFDSDILKYQIQKNDLAVKLMEVEEITEFIVNSPIEGRLETSNVTIGQTVHEGNSLAQINPTQQRDYKLIFWVPNSAIAWLKQQQSVKIRYDAFPYEKFGQFEEKIEVISTVPASAQELSYYKNSQINPDPNDPLYKVIASVQHRQVIYDQKRLKLTDGMRANVTIFLEKRPLYQWIFEPLYSLQKTISTPDNE